MAPITRLPAATYTSLIESLYASLMNQQGFDQFLATLQHSFNGCSVILLPIRQEPDALQWGWTLGVTAAFQRWCKESQFFTAHDAIIHLQQVGISAKGFVIAGQLLEGGELVDCVNDTLKPWLRKEAVIDSAGLIIPVSTHHHFLLALQRNSGAGRFNDDDIQQMNILAPHIKQAAQLFIQLYQLERGLPKAAFIQNRFCLTPAEAMVCELLVAGRTLKHIATQRNVSVNTVREQMRQIYQKTGYKRQAEVVAAILLATRA